MFALRDLRLRTRSAGFLAIGAESWPLSKGALPLGLARFRGMLWDRIGAWPVAREVRSEAAAVPRIWRLAVGAPAAAGVAPEIHLNARRWLALSLEWTFSLRLPPGAHAPGRTVLAENLGSVGFGGNPPRASGFSQEPRFLFPAAALGGFAATLLESPRAGADEQRRSRAGGISGPGRGAAGVGRTFTLLRYGSGRRVYRDSGRTRDPRMPGGSSSAGSAPGMVWARTARRDGTGGLLHFRAGRMRFHASETGAAAALHPRTAQSPTVPAARARLAQRALSRLEAGNMTLVRGPEIKVPLRTLAFLAGDGWDASRGPSSGSTRWAPVARIPREVPGVARHVGSRQRTLGSGSELRRAPTFSRRTGSLWDGDAARARAGEAEGAPVSTAGRVPSSPSSPSGSASSSLFRTPGADAVRPATVIGTPAPAAVYRLAAPVPLPPAGVQAGVRHPASAASDVLDSTVSRLVATDLRRWEQQHLAPKRLAELASRSLEQQLRRERERLGA